MIDKVVKIGIPLAALWAAKKLKESYDKNKQEIEKSFVKGKSEGYEMSKNQAKNLSLFKNFIFDDRGLDSEIDKSAWCNDMIRALNETNQLIALKRAMRYEAHFFFMQGIPSPFAVPLHWQTQKCKAYNDTSYLVRFDMCYKFLRDEFLLNLHDGLNSSKVCKTKLVMDSWYLTQRERYLRACIVEESAYSIDLSLLKLTRLESEIEGICEKYSQCQRSDEVGLKSYVDEAFRSFEKAQEGLEDVWIISPYVLKKEIYQDFQGTSQKEAWLEIILEIWFSGFEDYYKISELYTQTKNDYYKTLCDKLTQ